MVWPAFTLLQLATFLTFASAVTLPGCQNLPPAQNTLNNVTFAYTDVPSSPFGLTYFSENIAFVALDDGNRSTLGVLDTEWFLPKLAHSIPLPAQYLVNAAEGGVGGIALTKDKRYLLVTAFKDTLLIDARKAARGESAIVVGVFNSTIPTLGSTVEVTTLDDYLFTSQEYGLTRKFPGSIAVYRIPQALSQHSSIPTLKAIGYIQLGESVVGTALSKDNKYLYTTSEGIVNGNGTIGSLSVLDVETLKRNASASLVTSIDAGCQPVRVAVHPDGKTVWVTARGSNRLLAFDTAKILSDPKNALLSSVQVGSNPVGLTFVEHGKRVLTADSSRFNATYTTGLTVVDTEKALKTGGDGAAFGRIPAGLPGSFPREMAVSPDGKTALLSLFMNQGPNEKPLYQVEAVDLGTLP